MRFTEFGLTTLKEVPAEAEIVSHKLMLRAGLIRRLASGLLEEVADPSDSGGSGPGDFAERGRLTWDVVDLNQILKEVVSRRGRGRQRFQRELDEEDEARRLHLQMLEHPLVLDVLDPDSLITPDELAATLLSAPLSEFEAVLSLFDADQLVLLSKDAHRLHDAIGDLPETQSAVAERLQLMEARLAVLIPSGILHG